MLTLDVRNCEIVNLKKWIAPLWVVLMLVNRQLSERTFDGGRWLLLCDVNWCKGFYCILVSHITFSSKLNVTLSFDTIIITQRQSIFEEEDELFHSLDANMVNHLQSIPTPRTRCTFNVFFDLSKSKSQRIYQSLWLNSIWMTTGPIQCQTNLHIAKL